ncbi:MAG: hypothetical protein PVG65_04445 [Candidatus Thorarchaeota archaeon]|jgi:hypothetical protein
MTQWKSDHSQYLDEWITFHYSVPRYREWEPLVDTIVSDEYLTAQAMYDAVDAQVAGLEDNLAQISQFVGELEDKVNAIEYYMTLAANNLESYLDSTKVLEIEQINGVDAELVLGSNYNDLENISTATLTDWKIIDSTSSETLYKYEGIGWDDDSIITSFISDWNFGKDYLIHSLLSFDGDYGIYPNLDVLDKATTTLDGTKNKINDSKDIIGDYL